MQKLALIGAPNVGKSSVYNTLVAGDQKIANWSGVTVSAAKSKMVNNANIEIWDLPGIHSLNICDNDVELDHKISQTSIFEQNFTTILNVVDYRNIEVQLFLSMQIKELGIPMILILNNASNIDANILEKLKKLLGCSIIINSSALIKDLSEILDKGLSRESSYVNLYPQSIEQAIVKISESIKPFLKNDKILYSRRIALGLLEGDITWSSLSADLPSIVSDQKRHIKKHIGEVADVAIASARFNLIGQYVQNSNKDNAKYKLTKILDRLFLHKYLGLPMFFIVMLLLFTTSILIAQKISGFYFDAINDFIFVHCSFLIGSYLGVPNWLNNVISLGVGTGIVTVLGFIPVLFTLYFLLGILEESGYMLRVAFVLDRVMRLLGLPGQSFIAMVVGFGCNVPAVMSSRMIRGRSERIITVIMSPFMSCGARLGVFTVFGAAFFAEYAPLIILSLYFIGVLMAVITALLTKKYILLEKTQPLASAISAYQLPNIKFLLINTYSKVKKFVIDSSKFIIPICAIFALLQSSSSQEDNLFVSSAKFVTPILSPLGIEKDNWQATVSLFVGVVAKEVVLGTLNTLYSEPDEIKINFTNFSELMLHLKQDFLQIFLEESNENTNLENILIEHFPTKAAAFSYMMFVLLYFPCVSVAFSIGREIREVWALFSVVWTTSLAYTSSTIFYQLATFLHHPLTSLFWIGVMIILLVKVFWLLQRYIYHYEKNIVPIPVVLMSGAYE